MGEEMMKKKKRIILGKDACWFQKIDFTAWFARDGKHGIMYQRGRVQSSAVLAHMYIV